MAVVAIAKLTRFLRLGKAGLVRAVVDLLQARAASEQSGKHPRT